MKDKKSQQEQIRRIVEWYFDISGFASCDNSNLKIFRDLINSKIACISHANHYRKSFNSTIKHYEREDFRDFLKDYVNKLIEQKLKENKNG